jgi:hypothetical protein
MRSKVLPVWKELGYADDHYFEYVAILSAAA